MVNLMEYTESIQDLILQMPGCVLLKDINLNFISVSSDFANLLGYDKPEMAIGTTDYEIKCDAANFAEDFRRQVDQILETGKPTHSLDLIRYSDGQLHVLHAKKKLLKASDGSITGVLAYCVDVTNSHVARLAMLLGDKHKPYRMLKLVKDVEQSKILSQGAQLTRRELHCLFYMLRGKSNKAIAHILGISIRTVETYIENVKLKFNCTNRSELIETAIALDYLDYLPEDLVLQGIYPLCQSLVQ